MIQRTLAPSSLYMRGFNNAIPSALTIRRDARVWLIEETETGFGGVHRRMTWTDRHPHTMPGGTPFMGEAGALGQVGDVSYRLIGTGTVETVVHQQVQQTVRDEYGDPVWEDTADGVEEVTEPVWVRTGRITVVEA
jgi:hypothetical protein